MDDGVFNILENGGSGSAEEGIIYQKLRTFNNGDNTDLYTKIWNNAYYCTYYGKKPIFIIIKTKMGKNSVPLIMS